MQRTAAVLGFLIGMSDLAGAQIIEGRVGGFGGQPKAWTSLSAGWMLQGGLCDPDSSACWDFGDALQWRATLEMPMGRGATVGVLGSTARMPLVYRGSALTPNSCTSCDADANISQLMATLRLGGGNIGFQQVVDFSAGMTLFSNFRDASGARLGTGKTTSDFSFIVGYGFGYGLSSRTSVMLVQDYGLVIHKRLAGNASNTAEQRTTRIGLRYGLGS